MEEHRASSAHRLATEFERQADRAAASPDTPHEYLRVFPDGDGTLVAGLYQTSERAINDHWAQGSPLTDKTDAMVAERLLPDNPPAQGEALAGLAYARLESDRTRQVNLQVPRKLKLWTVRMPAGDSPGARVPVMATGEDVAIAVAALVLLDTRGPTWTAARW